MTFSTTSISGAKAFRAGKALECNPWVVGSNQFREWRRGWIAERDGEKAPVALVSKGAVRENLESNRAEVR